MNLTNTAQSVVFILKGVISLSKQRFGERRGNGFLKTYILFFLRNWYKLKPTLRRVEFKRQLELGEIEKREILNLWNDEYPEKLNYHTLSEFEEYLRSLTGQSHILMINENQSIIGWYFDFIRKNERWFAIIIDSKYQGKGLGTKLLKLGKEKESELNGWVIDKLGSKKRNGELYKSPLNFYIKNGFEKFENERLELEKLSAVKIKWKK